MLRSLWARLQQGYRTLPFPEKEPQLPERLRGRLTMDLAKCPPGCWDCEKACPTQALKVQKTDGQPQLDLGRCLFCTDCIEGCSKKNLNFSPEYRLSSRTRGGLVTCPASAEPLESAKAAAVRDQIQKLFGRSLKLRQVSAGGCNACEADVNVLGTIGYDLGRFGIQMVASPRHADGILVTGPVTKNMELALRKTYEAVASPKIVIAVGACAISGGMFREHAESNAGLEGILPVDLYIPGCPPHPFTILDGLLHHLQARSRP